jgi:hypothetical protein
MNKIKTSHILFSLALIAVLALAVVPAAPVYALSASATNPVIAANQGSASALAPNGIVVCKTIIEWHNGHRVAVRRCHKVEKTAS